MKYFLATSFLTWMDLKMTGASTAGCLQKIIIMTDRRELQCLPTLMVRNIQWIQGQSTLVDISHVFPVNTLAFLIQRSYRGKEPLC
jgi:hypothetical protein